MSLDCVRYISVCDTDLDCVMHVRSVRIRQEAPLCEARSLNVSGSVHSLGHPVRHRWVRHALDLTVRHLSFGEGAGVIVRSSWISHWSTFTFTVGRSSICPR